MRPYAVSDFRLDPYKPGRLPKVYAAGFFDGTQTSLYWGDDALAQWWERASHFDGMIFFHDESDHDFHYALDVLPLLHCKWTVIGSRIVEIRITGAITLRDSWALIPIPLSSAKKNPVRPRDHEPSLRENHRSEIMRQLSRELDETHELLRGYFQMHDAKSITLAGATFRALKATVPEMPRVTADFDATYRPFFFGGRVQFFEQGQIRCPVHVLDINSAFPAAMCKPQWWGVRASVRGTIPRQHAEQSLLEISCYSAGNLPWRGGGGDVEWPVGRSTFFITGWEFLTAQKLGLIRDVKILTIYTPAEVQHYRKFIEPRYDAKLNAPTPEERLVAKLELNAAYGKFALRPDGFREVRILPYGELLPEPWELSYDDIDRGLSFWQRPSVTGRSADDAREVGDQPDKPVFWNNVATACGITGKVRAQMMEAIALAGKVVYCDTDSIFIRAGALKKFDLGIGLGQWRREFVFEKLWIAGPKLYAGWGYDPAITPRVREWKTAAKGVRMTPEKIIRIAMGGRARFTFPAPALSVFSPTQFTSRRLARTPRHKIQPK